MNQAIHGSYANYPSLRDRVVFISGGSSGIGAELVRAFAQQGHAWPSAARKPVALMC